MVKSHSNEITKADLVNLKDLRRGVGLRKFTFAKDRSYTQWKARTENTTIRIFGEKSNQLRQFRDAISWYQDTYLDSYSTGLDKEFERLDDTNIDDDDKKICVDHTQTFKNKMRDILGAWIEEIEYLMKSKSLAPTSKTSKQNGAKPKNIQVQKVDISIQLNIDQTITTIIENIKSQEPEEKRIKEAESQLKNFSDEIKKTQPEWSKIKKTLEWALNFGRDVFIQILPILLQKYNS